MHSSDRTTAVTKATVWVHLRLATSTISARIRTGTVTTVEPATSNASAKVVSVPLRCDEANSSHHSSNGWNHGRTGSISTETVSTTAMPSSPTDNQPARRRARRSARESSAASATGSLASTCSSSGASASGSPRSTDGLTGPPAAGAR